MRITVRQGVVSSTETLNPRPADPAPNPGRTIDERFSDIASSIVSASTGECAELAAAYDASDGRPISLSSGTALKNLADGNGFWTISNFTRL